jgi:hypothetical protein
MSDHCATIFLLFVKLPAHRPYALQGSQLTSQFNHMHSAAATSAGAASLSR